MPSTSLARLLGSFSRQSRDLVQRYVPAMLGREKVKDCGAELEALARALLSSRGEASGVALASDLLASFALASPEERGDFFAMLATGFDPDAEALAAAWADYARSGAPALPALSQAVEAPRQELLRRINLAPGGTAGLVAMRADLLPRLDLKHPDFVPALARVEADFVHLLQSWFNRGFLTMGAISWSSPASLLERLIRYEAVHDIQDWEDLRRRIDPSDRRCYAFFHPSLPDEPLIFVEVALTRGLADNVQAILDAGRVPIAAEEATTAIFYSISNCQPGLKGISFGHFLIKQVATELKRDLPRLEQFATLSPVPGLRGWLRREAPEVDAGLDSGLEQVLADGDDAELRSHLLPHVATYFLDARTRSGKPVDPVARFHLGNGARLERMNWLGDISPNGLRQSAGIMVNYLYDLARIEENHEAFAHRGEIAVGEPFRRTATQTTKPAKSRRKAGTADRASSGRPLQPPT